MSRRGINILVTGSGLSNAALASHIEALTSPDGLESLGGLISYILPTVASKPEPRPGWYFYAADEHRAAATWAVESASRAGKHLLILFGAVTPSSEAIGMLVETFERDAMFGFAVPRMATADGFRIEKLAAEIADPEICDIPRRALSEIPANYILPQPIGPCVVVRSDLVANLPPLDTGFEALAGAFLHLVCRARRIGYRCVVSNQAVIPHVPAEYVNCIPGSADIWKCLREYPESGRAWAELQRLSCHTYESRLARALSPDTRLSRTLLIDGSGMGACFNGTSHCALGMADGLAGFAHDWSITLLVSPEAAAFHHISERYPGWRVTHDASCRATAAVRVSQPFAMSTIIDVHQQALLNFYLILDTIAWDTLFEAPEELDAVWRFLSTYADGLLYISDFTGDRFRTRFPVAPSVREHTMYLSFDPADYVGHALGSTASEGSYILVIGNHYEHKNVSPTVELLTACFPYQSIQTVGLARSDNPRVAVMPSGNIPESDMDRLYAGASMVIFPSYYEGFGFPVIRGLSYGKTVLARRSELLGELAANYRGPGRLVAFDNPMEMVEVIGQILHQQPIQALPLGTAIPPDAPPLGWVAIGRKLLAFIENNAANPGGAKWTAREQAIQQMMAYRR